MSNQEKIYCYFIPKYSFVVEDRIFKKDEEYPVYIQDDYLILVAENGEFNLTKKALDETIKNWKDQVTVKMEEE